MERGCTYTKRLITTYALTLLHKKTKLIDYLLLKHLFQVVLVELLIPEDITPMDLGEKNSLGDFFTNSYLSYFNLNYLLRL